MPPVDAPAMRVSEIAHVCAHALTGARMACEGAQELEHALKVKSASECSSEDTVRRLREREAKDRVRGAERERALETAIGRERAAWRAKARELVGMLSDTRLLVSELRVGVGEEEYCRRQRSPAARCAHGSRSGCLQPQPTAAAAGARPEIRGIVAQVWQEEAVVDDEVEAAALRVKLGEGETLVEMLQAKLGARDKQHEQLREEHAKMRKAFLAAQLELKIAREGAWVAEEELQCTRANLSARCGHARLASCCAPPRRPAAPPCR